MLQRGRVSKANLLAFPLDIEQVRIQPPAWLTRPEKKLFVEIVSACRPMHFAAADESLLVSFVQATLLARSSIKKANKDRAALAAWEKATRTQAVLATKLRLAPQSRLDQRAAARGLLSVPVASSRPWEEA